MTETMSRTGVRRYRSRVEADQLVAEFQASGLTQRDFCEQHQVALKTLSRYVSRHSRQQRKGTPKLLRVEVSEAAGLGSGITVVLAGRRRVELAKGFDTATLAQAMSVLERL